MIPIFKSYPIHPWLKEWPLEPRNCGTSFRGNDAGLFFQTLETVGRIAPNLDAPGWALLIPVPQNSQTHILFNGFSASLARKKSIHSAEVIVPEPGVLLGRFSGIPSPSLISDEYSVEETDGFQWLENESAPALLAVRNEQFCLVTKAHSRTKAIEIAKNHLAQNVEELLQQELDQRANVAQLAKETPRHASVTAIHAESMMRALRPAEGNIPLPWSQSQESDVPEFNMNEVYPLALGWRLLDIHIAEQLILCALRTQASSGAIAVHYAPHATHSTLEAPKPLLAKAALAVWEVRKDPNFLDTILPPLRRHLQWMLHHFDPKRRGLFCWKNQNEPIVQGSYETDRATVDLSTLLLTEIEAFEQLRLQSESLASGNPAFQPERDNLENNLQNLFWNETDAAFNKAFARDRETPETGFPALAPLLWGKLPKARKSAILDRIQETGELPGSLSVLNWRKSGSGDHATPLLQQILSFQSLKKAAPKSALTNDYSRLILQEAAEQHSLSIEQNGTLRSDPATAAYTLVVQAERNLQNQVEGASSGRLAKFLKKTKINSFEVAVAAITVFALTGLHIVYDVINAPPPFGLLEADLTTAYASKNAAAIQQNSYLIIEHYPEEAALAKLYSSNLSIFSGNFLDASELLADVRTEYPDSPGAMISLGLSLQQQGRFVEAEKNYSEFCYLFDEIFPDLVERINHFRFLMQEGFEAPPKWKTIYDYKLMHEL